MRKFTSKPSSRVAASSEWACDWSKRFDRETNETYYVMSCPAGSARVTALDDGMFMVDANRRNDASSGESLTFADMYDGMKWAEEYILKKGDGKNTFRFYFKDGNQQMFEAPNMYDALSYVLFEVKRYNAIDIWKIEEVDR